MTEPRRFDIRGPLPTGVTVLEASAGTGKTYTLAALAARYVTSGIPLREILLVTFTRLATGELRERVRERLLEAEEGLTRVLDGQLVPADDVVQLLATGPADDVRIRRDRLTHALADFDAATIATTHGFCLEALSGLGIVGDVEQGCDVAEDAFDLLENVVDDLYIRRFGPRDKPAFTRREAFEIARAAVANPKATILPVDTTGDGRPAMRARLAGVARDELERRKRLLGILTFDDVMDVARALATHDIQKLGGMEALEGPYLETSFRQMVRKRAGWLAVLFVGEMLTATAMGYFENEIAHAVVLALFLPLIISSGGNSGSQATTLVIRAMALGEVRLRDWWRVVSRELATGLALGAILGTIGISRILMWQAVRGVYGPHYALIAVTIGCSLVGVVLFGAVAGSMLPFVLRRCGLDPASASAPFVATLVDVTGLVIYFTVASIVLRGTLL